MGEDLVGVGDPRFGGEGFGDLTEGRELRIDAESAKSSRRAKRVRWVRQKDESRDVPSPSPPELP